MAKGIFAPANASARANPSIWMPMIRVSISDATSNDREHILDDDIVALIDTGADLCRIDETLIAKYKTFQSLGTTTSSSPTGSLTTNVYLVQIIIDGHRLLMQCPEAPLNRFEGAFYGLLLGMDAIQYFDLSVNRASPLVTLSWNQSQ